MQNNLIYSLEDISFISGSRQCFAFNVFKDNIPLDLFGCSIRWFLSYLGHPEYPVLEKAGLIYDNNKFKIFLETADTKDLSGKFIHQPVIISANGEEYRPAQGIITIIPRII